MNKIPRGYALCSLTDCPLASTCVRQCVYETLPESVETVTLLNPKSVSFSDAGCQHFRPYQIVHNAYGFTSLYKQIPVGNARDFQNSIPSITSESMYFRMKRGDRPIPSSVQQQILSSAISLGAPSTVQFDRYEDEILY